jgi:hypothetical protein
MRTEWAVRSGDIGGVAHWRRPARPDTAAGGERSNLLAAWLVLIGLILPAAEVQVFVAGAKFTVGRIGIALLLLPAIVALSKKGRRLLTADFLILATAIWMVGAAVHTDGAAALSSAGAEAFELLGGYLVARAYFFGAAAVRTFLAVLKILAIIAVLLGLVDRLSGRLMIHDFLGSLTNIAPISPQERMGVLRATSTFDHAILFGLFCAVAGAMLLYSERRVVNRCVYVAICLFGSFLSLSSSSLMGFAILFGAYAVDMLGRRYPRLWSAFWTVCGILGLIIMLVTAHPLGWVLSHLTLEPESGYFRLMEWDAATYMISLSPWTGYAFANFGTAELFSVDTVWLALALRFGLPAIALLLLANITVLLPSKKTRETGDPYLDWVRKAFVVVLVLYMFIGLTVHYWNYMWLFWGVCLGITASMREKALAESDRSTAFSRSTSLAALARESARPFDHRATAF